MTELWAFKIGDRLYPAPSRDEAEAKARELSTFVSRLPASGTPSISVAPWNGTEAEHQIGLLEWAPAKAN